MCVAKTYNGIDPTTSSQNNKAVCIDLPLQIELVEATFSEHATSSVLGHLWGQHLVKEGCLLAVACQLGIFQFLADIDGNGR